MDSLSALLYGMTNQITLTRLKEAYAEAAQEVYDNWHQDEDGYDEELGTGGICSKIVDAFCLFCSEEGYDTLRVGGYDHEWVAVEVGKKIYEVDIPCSLYETGGGYNWTKIDGVEFSPADVSVWESTHTVNALLNEFAV